MNYRCPICRAPADSETGANFPFCSERCRLLDLGKWASGEYKVVDKVGYEDKGTARDLEPGEPDR